MKEIPKAFYHSENNEETIFRDYLVVERTRLANERTLLSYIRTSLYLLLGAIAFFSSKGWIKLNGSVIRPLFSAFCHLLLASLNITG